MHLEISLLLLAVHLCLNFRSKKKLAFSLKTNLDSRRTRNHDEERQVSGDSVFDQIAWSMVYCVKDESQLTVARLILSVVGERRRL